MTNEEILALIAHQTYNYRASSAVVNELTAQYDAMFSQAVNKLRELLDELTESERTAFTSNVYSTDRLKEMRSVFDSIQDSIATTLPESFMLSAIPYAIYEAEFMAKLYKKPVKVSEKALKDAIVKRPVVGGELFDEIWKDLGQKARRNALLAVRNGINQGDNTADIARALKGKRVKVGNEYKYVGGLLEKTKNSIDGDVRTIRSHVSQVAYKEIYDALGFEYLRSFSVMDGRTTFICASLDGTVWHKDDPSIVWTPRHRRCRTVLLGVNKDGNIEGKQPFVEDNRAVKNIPKDERAGKIGRIDANVTFKQWFDTADSKFQEDWLGKTRYDLYKNGDYTIDRFVAPNGGQYTLKQLRELDKKTFKELEL